MHTFLFWCVWLIFKSMNISPFCHGLWACDSGDCGSFPFDYCYLQSSAASISLSLPSSLKEENARLQYALRARKIQQQRIWRAAFAWQRRAGWVYPRLQGWFEEMYQNQAMSSLWKKWPPYFMETYCYICQMLGSDLTTQNTHLRRAIPLTKRVNYIIKVRDGGALKWKERRVQNAPPASISQLVISDVS